MRPSLFAAALALASPAASVTVVVNQSFAASSVPALGQPLDAAFALDVGDTLDLTYAFTGGAVALQGESYLWMLALASSGGAQSLTVSGTLQFLGGSANLLSGPFAPVLTPQTAAQRHVGLFTRPADYRIDGALATFTGIRMILSLDASSPGLDFNGDPFTTGPRIYGLGGLTFNRDQPSSAPEPATWAMLVLGFGAVGSALRRRARIAA